MLMRSGEGFSSLDDPVDEVSIRRNQRGGGGTTNVAGLLDLRGLWLTLRWRVRLIGFIAIAFVVAATGALAILPPKYKATTVVLVDPRQPQITNNQAVLTGIGADAAAVESQVELIESSALAKKVIARLKLDQDPDFVTPSLTERISDTVLTLIGRGADASENAKLTRLVYKFQSGLVVRRRGLTYVLEISYSAKDPAKAARISTAVAEAYLDDQRAAKAEITTRASGWLGDRIEEIRGRVRSAEEAVTAYRAANNLVDVTQGNKLINRQVEDLTQQLALTRSRTADARARLERVQQAAQHNSDPATLNEALQSPVIANLRSQYAETARLKAEYTAVYGSKHPALIAATAQLDDLRRQIDNEIARILVGVRNDYQTAMSREASLEAELTKLKDQSAALGQADVKLRELEREAQANRTLFEQFLNRAKETTEQESLQIADARIVAPALSPLRPDRPGALLLIALAACAGVICGVGLVLVLEQLRQSFRSGREVAQFLSLPSIGMLPMQEAPRARRSVAARFALDHPNSAYARSLRAIRARLLRSSKKPRGEILAVVSALTGEGKSTFASNFALAAEHSGVRTLLIDGDVYAASSTLAYSLQRAGLLEVLAGKAMFWNAVAKDAKSGLHVLGARDPSTGHDDARDIDPARLASLLREYGKHFDLVVIDCPAILPIGGTVPTVDCADRAILLVEWDRTHRQAVAEALDALDLHPGKLAGVVLNKVSLGWCELFDYGGYYRTFTTARAVDTKAAA
jgi:succinoglycan biosynthesis transport protein ExoP